MRLRSLSILVIAAATLFGGAADAADPPIAVGEVSPPPGIDAAAIRDAAEVEIKQIDTSRIPDRRRVVVSLAVADGPTACTVNAMLRDARTGTMIAIIEHSMQADGSTVEQRRLMANRAVRSAVRRIPKALGGR